MNMQTPNGFLILSILPSFPERASKELPLYRGARRDSLLKLHLDYLRKKLPAEMTGLYETLRNQIAVCCDFDAVFTIESARVLLDYCNANGEDNEIVAFRSEYYDDLYPPLSAITTTMKWLGYDIILSGSYSLIEQGIHSKPFLFSEFVPKLNSNGLFEKPELYAAYTDEYIKLARGGKSIEDAWIEDDKFQIIRVDLAAVKI